MAEPPQVPEAPQPELHTMPAAPSPAEQEAALQKLFELAAPLWQAHLDDQKDKRTQEIGFELKYLEHESKRHRLVVIAAGGISVAVLVLAGYVFYLGRDATALDLIKTIAAIAGVGFGGYGLAIGRAAAKSEDE